MAKALTATAVLKFRPGTLRREVPDGGCLGLHLVIQPSGTKSWALRYRRPDNRSAKLSLGHVFELPGEEPEVQPTIGGYARIWGDAMRAAVRGDTDEISKLLKNGTTIPPEVARFLGWFIAPRGNGRPPMPEEFKWLNEDLRLYDAFLQFEIERANWRAREGRRKFPRTQMIEKVARNWDISADTLENKLKRSGSSGRGMKLFPY